jgi:hypothetical protein
MAIFLGIILLYRIFIGHFRHLRLVAAITSSKSTNYFAQPLSDGLLRLQKHILLAPLFGRRHNKPFQTRFFGLYMGTLPSRINAIIIFSYILSNVLYCTLLLPWSGKVGPDNKLQAPTNAALIAEFRGRTGVMATINMIPLFVCMMRNNYVGTTIGVGFNTWNLYHRWAGRIVVLQSFAHVGAWMTNQVNYRGWNGVLEAFCERRFLQMGLLVWGFDYFG